jgi:hypothetical protein
MPFNYLPKPPQTDRHWFLENLLNFLGMRIRLSLFTLCSMAGKLLHLLLPNAERKEIFVIFRNAKSNHLNSFELIVSHFEISDSFPCILYRCGRVFGFCQ